MIDHKTDNVLRELRNIIKNEQLHTDAAMKDHTTMRVGGAAKVLVTPSSCEEVIDIVKLLNHMGEPYFVMGNGSNLLVADSGYSGVIIKLSDNLSDVSTEGEEITALAGAPIVAVSNAALKHSLTGLEFAAGIPGTTGGAVFMNAGAYDGQMEDVVTETFCINKSGETVLLKGKEHEFGYRTSAIQKNNLIALRVKMKLNTGKQEEIKAKMQLLNCLRREKQPLNYPSAGSVFKRPTGYYAGQLIQEAGLSGFNIGGARISEKHCGFIINTGNATATDVINLIQYTKEKVWQKFGVLLEQEVKILGGYCSKVQKDSGGSADTSSR